MDPTIGVVALALAFIATHIGLATDAMRRRLEARLGERGFVAAYSAVATIGFAAVVGYYAAHRGAGAPNPAAALADAVPARVLLEAAVIAGIALATAGLAAYPRLRARGAPYADYLAAASTLPFTAIVAGRQRLIWRGLPWATLAAGGAAAMVVRLVHVSLFAAGGFWIVLALIGVAVVASVQSWRRAHRRTSRAGSAPMQPAWSWTGGAAAQPSRSRSGAVAVRS